MSEEIARPGRKAPTVGPVRNERVAPNAATDQMEAAAQRAIAEVTPALLDSICSGVMVLSFWSGGQIPQGQFASHFLISPTLRPEMVAPFLRTIADELDKVRPNG